MASRTKNSLRNMTSALIMNAANILANLIARKIFISLLGGEYLGLDNLFSNVISMLSIAELGISSAIIYNLYRPIAQGDQRTIVSLMRFYRRGYHIISITILALGLCALPFLPSFIDMSSAPAGINIYVAYLIFLLNSSASYLLSYKRGIIYAYQKNYIINSAHVACIIIKTSLQLALLYLTRNYYVYLCADFILDIIENLALTLIANHMFPFLIERTPQALPSAIKKDVFKKVRALFLHKIGGFIVLGSDNIIISKFLGLVEVGLYSNYYLIINAVQSIISQIVASTTASIGNLLASNGGNHSYVVFSRVRFANFCLSTVAGVCLATLLPDFIRLWLGDDFVLPPSVLIALVINFFITSNRSVYNSFKDAAGIYHEDRFVPLLESLINIVASVALVQWLGLTGVFIGTIVSSMVLWLYSYPKFVYMKLFNRRYLKYLIETITYFSVFVLVLIITHLVCLLVDKQPILNLIAKTILSIIIPVSILVVIYLRSDNGRYYLGLLKKLVNRY